MEQQSSCCSQKFRRYEVWSGGTGDVTRQRGAGAGASWRPTSGQDPISLVAVARCRSGPSQHQHQAGAGLSKK